MSPRLLKYVSAPCAVFTILFFAQIAFAQGGSVSGTVSDALGARVVSADVTLLLPGTAANGRAHCVLGALPIQQGQHAAEGAVDVLLRPEQIDVLPESAQRDGTLEAVVRAITFQGQDAALTLQLIDAHATIRARVPGYRTPREGERVRLAVGGEVSVYPR